MSNMSNKIISADMQVNVSLETGSLFKQGIPIDMAIEREKRRSSIKPF